MKNPFLKYYLYVRIGLKLEFFCDKLIIYYETSKQSVKFKILSLLVFDTCYHGIDNIILFFYFMKTDSHIHNVGSEIIVQHMQLK